MATARHPKTAIFLYYGSIQLLHKVNRKNMGQRDRRGGEGGRVAFKSPKRKRAVRRPKIRQARKTLYGGYACLGFIIIKKNNAVLETAGNTANSFWTQNGRMERELELTINRGKKNETATSSERIIIILPGIGAGGPKLSHEPHD